MAFVVFEGGEGAGKSTLLGGIARRLRGEGQPVAASREPGGTPLGEQIRALFKRPPQEDAPSALCEVLLVLAARAQHVDRCLRPALARGEWVLCDRFQDSTYVYQCVAGGLDKALVDQLSLPVLGDLAPALTVVIDVPVDVARGRLEGRAQDRFDGGGRLELYRHGFLSLVNGGWSYPGGKTPHRILVDGSAPAHEVEERVWQEVRRL